MSALALYELTAEERHLAMMAYGCAYEWAVEYADPLDNSEVLATTFARIPWLLLNVEPDTLNFTARQQEIFYQWTLAGINSGQYRADEIARQNHRIFHATVQAVARSQFASYADLQAYRARIRRGEKVTA
jgi:hypothetical protein